MQALRRWTPAVAALAALTTAACSDTTGIGELVPGLDVPQVVDFGDVRVGVTNTREVVLRNSGAAPLSLRLTLGPGASEATHSFSIAPATLALEAGQSVTVTATFQALTATAQPVRTVLSLATGAANPDGTPFGATLELRGRGTRATLVVEPTPLDFGAVLLGSSRTLALRLTNPLPTPLALRSAADAMGRPRVDSEAGGGQFVILAEPALFTLASGETRTVEARYAPAAVEADRARWVISTCEGAICDVEVELLGQGTESALACAPAAVDFGAVNPGRAARRAVRCTNAASDPIELVGWSLDPNSAPELTAEPFASATLAPGASFEVGVLLSPPMDEASLGAAYEGTLVVRGRSAVTGDGVTPVRVALRGSAGGPRIAVLPAALHFGAVEVGTRDRRTVAIVNEGYSDLMFTVGSTGAAAFSSSGTGSTRLLAAGTATVVSVAFAPTAPGPAEGALLLSSNDAVQPELRVPLAGEGVALGPCTLALAPPLLAFGVVPIGEPRVLGLRLENTGSGTCLVNHLEISAGAPAFRLTGGPRPALRLAPGAVEVIEVEYRPRASGPDVGALDLYASDPAASLRTVPLSGTGFGTTQVTCPAPISVPAGTQVALEARATSRTGTIASHLWEIVTAPTGGIGTPQQWAPDPPAAAQVLFRPYLVGRYDLRVTAADTDGLTATCTTAVTAVGHGLRVELTWDGLGDVDLHVHNGNPTPWFGRGTTGGAEDDCFYANCSQSAVVQGPLWDPASPYFEGRNPGLDFDNIVGFGPENTHVDDVRAGDTFTVALHYFWDHGHGPRIATAHVYCGPTAVPTATFTSTTMIGLDQGGCTQNTFWKVATLTFTSSSACTVTPLGIYQPGADACAAF